MPSTVTIASVDEPVPQAAESTVSYTVTNNQTGERDIEVVWLIDDTIIDSEVRNVGGSDSASGFLTGEIPVEHARRTEITVESRDAGTGTVEDSADGTIDILERAIIDIISVESAPDEVLGGDFATWELEVENIGADRGTATVELLNDNVITVFEDTSRDHALSAGETISTSVTAPTSRLNTDVDADWILRSSPNPQPSTATGTATVLETPEADLRLSINSINAPVAVNEQLQVDVGVGNETETGVTDTVELLVDGAIEDSESISLAAKEDTEVQLVFDAPTVSDIGDLEFVVAAESQPVSRSGSAKVVERPPLRLGIDRLTDPVTVGESIDADVNAANDDQELQASDSIEFVIDGSVEDTASVVLGPGETTTEDVSGPVQTEDDVGTRDIEVRAETAPTTRSASVRVRQRPEFRLSINGTNGPVTPAETLRVQIGVENDSDQQLSDDVELQVSGTVVDAESVTLTAQSSASIELTYADVDTDDIGDLAFSVQTDSQDVTRSGTAKIVSEEALEIVGIEAPTTADIDDQVTWDVDVENIGSEMTEATVRLALGDAGTVAEQPVELSPGETTTVGLDYRIRPTDLEDIIWTVSVTDDEATGEIDVFDPGPVNIESVSGPTAVDEGEDLPLTVRLSADRQIATPARVFVDGDQRVRRVVSLPGRRPGYREAREIDLQVPTEPGEAADDVGILVDVRGDQATKTVVIEARRFFRITSLASDGPTPPGEVVQVTADIENAGSISGDDTISLDIEDGGTDSATETLDSGETTSVALSAAVPVGETIADGTVSTSTTADTISLVVREGIRRRIPDGDVVEIDVGDSTIRPDVIADVQWTPGVGSVPELVVPVPRDERWFDLDLPLPARAWTDGDRLPIEELEDVRRSDERDELVLKGGRELREYRDQITLPDGQPADVVRSVLEETDLEPDVDDFEATTRTDVTLRETDDGDAFRRRVVDSPGRLSLWGFVEDSGEARPEPRQTAHFIPAPQEFDEGAESTIQDERFHNGEAYEGISDALNDRIFNGGPVSLDYPLETNAADEIDASVGQMAGIAIRKRTPTELPGTFGGSAHPGFRISVEDSDGETLAAVQVPADALRQDDDPAWFSQRLDSGLPADEPLSIEIDFNRRSDEDDAKLQVGSVLLFDRRQRIRPDDDGVEDGIVQGLDLFPTPDEDVRVELRDTLSVETIEEATASQTVSDAATGRLTAISVDRGGSFTEAENTDAVTVEGGAVQRARSAHRLVGVEGPGDSTTPQGRNEPMRLEAVSIEADVNDTPLIQDRHQRGTLEEVLQEIAQDTDAIWELRWDPDEQRQQLSWTWPGQRPAQSVDGVVDVDVERKSSDSAQRVVAFGSAFSVEEEIEVPAQGETIELDEGWIVPGSERLADPDTGRRFVRGVDYSIEYNADRGQLTVLEGSRMPEGAELAVEYESKPRAEHIAQDFQSVDESELDTAEVDNLNIQSEEAIGQVALVAAEDLAEPQTEATVTLSELDPTASVLGGLAIDELPFDDAETVAGVEVDEASVAIRLSNRSSLQQTLSGLRSDLERQADRL